MRFTRHARNRLRLIRRLHGEIDLMLIVGALPTGETLGYDERGNRRVEVSLGGLSVVVDVDEEDDVVVTLWRID